MEYGTWQARAAAEGRDDRSWAATIRAFRKHTGHVGLFGHVAITGVSISRKSEGWRFVWRACVLGEHKVAFIDSLYLVEGFSHSLVLLDTNSIVWHSDKYARK